jgi:uncharacterized protein involved in exopolysaccharide biosynthesis/Mrp family chromosome partitioning ATPase
MNLPNQAQTAPQAPTFTVGDIYYVLFRHKWKIILCSIAGILAASAYYKYFPPPFQSEARLLIKYVVESQSVAAAGSERSPDRGGDTIISTEVEILTSLDLAEQVAKTIGPDKIIGRPAGPEEINYAASIIASHLTVEVPMHSSVLHVVFAHKNRALVQPILNEIINQYFKRHVEIHRASGSGFLTSETDQLRSRLAQTEEELRKARNKAGVINLDEAKKTYAEQISRLRQEIAAAQADVSERSEVLHEMSHQSPDAANSETQSAVDASPEPTPDQISQYRTLVSREDALNKREQQILINGFREDSTRVKEVQAQLAEVQARKKILEDAAPKLARSFVPIVAVHANGNPNTGPTDVATETIRVNALKAKIKVLSAQLETVRAEAAKTDEMEVTILQLTRQKNIEEANYQKYAQSLEQTRINEALGSGGVSNISQIQSPSPPYADMKKSLKIIGGLAGVGIAFGFGWAFLIEFYLDRSVRRPIDVERMLRLPLFLSIPKLSHKELRLGPGKSKLALPAPAAGKAAGSELTLKNSNELAPWDAEHPLHPFHETLRDRLISYFESKGLTHKPKLVAVTGLGHNGGVTTIAAGLASSLSETGDGNVLLVDMTQGQGSAQQFYQGKAVCGLEEILDARASAQIEDNLYVVGQEPGGEKLSRILPGRFNKLVPKLKASNFDYIIFDMPPVSQISITPRLAGFMDMVLLVLESEKTDRDLVQRATALLAESKAHVGAVLNKTTTYVPPKLHQDNLGNS